MLKVRPEDYIFFSNDRDGFCMTRLIKLDAPFLILGLPVYKDYRIVHQHSENYMSFMHGYSDSKPMPSTHGSVSTDKD